MKHFAVLISLLRDRKNFFEEIRRDVKTENKIISLLVSSSVFFAIYGAIVGASSSGLQVISSAIKLPALYLITLAICLPTLYFFDILFGSGLNFGQYAALALISVAVISVLLFSFAPITLFFLISIHDYNFFLLLNVAIFTFTGLMGVKFLYQAMQSMERPEEAQAIVAEPEPEQAHDFVLLEPPLKQQNNIQTVQVGNLKTRKKLLQFWLVLYGLVGSQLGWTLRPFFGASGEPFQLFRTIEGNFYAQVFRSFLTLMGWH
jgi:hypothetical protein